MANMALAAAHADTFWFRPCADDTVWTKTRAISLSQEARSFNKNPAEWVGRFLFMDDGAFLTEGLYLIPAVRASLGELRAKGFRSDEFSDRKFICSWYDAGATDDDGLKPKYHGLNDCAHFVSECMKAAGLGAVATTSAAQLVANLRARADTKTLALNVSRSAAKRIVNSDVMTPGDVIAFSDGSRFRHTTLFLGDKKIAMHTNINHPTLNVIRNVEEGENWMKSANTTHPLVTLIHFNYRDLDPALASWLPGWWEMVTGGRPFFYHFTATGKAAWTSQRPSALNSPPTQPGGTGYWFVNSEGDVNVCWRDTGSLDIIFHSSTLPKTFGLSNGDELFATRLGP